MTGDTTVFKADNSRQRQCVLIGESLQLTITHTAAVSLSSVTSGLKEFDNSPKIYKTNELCYHE